MSYKSKINVTNYYNKVLIAFYCLISAFFLLQTILTIIKNLEISGILKALAWN